VFYWPTIFSADWTSVTHTASNSPSLSNFVSNLNDATSFTSVHGFNVNLSPLNASLPVNFDGMLVSSAIL
jgi:hypothetical protein